MQRPIVEIGERELAKVSRGMARFGNQALASRWKEAIRFGIARRSTEHIVVIEG